MDFYSCRGEGGVGARFIAPWVGLYGRPPVISLKDVDPFKPVKNFKEESTYAANQESLQRLVSLFCPFIYFCNRRLCNGACEFRFRYSYCHCQSRECVVGVTCQYTEESDSNIK